MIGVEDAREFLEHARNLCEEWIKRLLPFHEETHHVTYYNEGVAVPSNKPKRYYVICLMMSEDESEARDFQGTIQDYLNKLQNKGGTMRFDFTRREYRY